MTPATKRQTKRGLIVLERVRHNVGANLRAEGPSS